MIAEIHNDFEEVILEENTNVNHDKNTLQNNTFNTNFYFRSSNSTSKNGGKKRWSSAMSSNTPETNANSAFSTETENFKINPYNVIMETTINPVEWRQEVDRVGKLLEISEYPEFLISGSESSLNVNNIVNNDEVELYRKLNYFTNYLGKSIKEKHISLIENLNNCISRDLKKIQTFEKNISSFDSMKNKIDKIQCNSKLINKLQNEFNEYNDKMNDLQMKNEDMTDNMNFIIEKEQTFKNDSTSNKEISKIKETIKILKSEINKLEMKNSFIEANLFQKRIIEHQYKNSIINKLGDYNYNDNIFDEIL